MKKSENVRQLLEAAAAEYQRLCQEMVVENPARTDDNYELLWDEFYQTHGWQLVRRQRELERELYKELNREIEVGDGVTMIFWSDAHAYTVIARTAKTITIQRDKATLDPGFKPEFIPGGFSAHCTNSSDQKWTYERDPNGEVVKCRWSEKHGCWRTGSDGSIKIIRGRHEHYDYNF